MITEALDEKWSLGVLIGLPIWLFVILICVIVTALLFWAAWAQREELYPDISFGFPITGFFVTLVVIVVGALGFYPWKAEYHKWIPKEGTVESINKRLVSDGDGMSEKIVVVIKGQEYACNDTRCTLVAKGDQLTMRCKRSWEYGSVDGYDCRFIARKPAT